MINNTRETDKVLIKGKDKKVETGTLRQLKNCSREKTMSYAISSCKHQSHKHSNPVFVSTRNTQLYEKINTLIQEHKPEELIVNRKEPRPQNKPAAAIAEMKTTHIVAEQSDE